MRRALAGAVIAVALLSLSVTSASGALLTETAQPTVQWSSVSDADSAALQLNETSAGNETERHRNPDDRDGQGNEEAVVSWLSGRLAGKLGDGAIQISEGQYELARDVLGGDYDDRLEQFVDVTGGGTEEEETLRTARDRQRELADLRQEFDETLAAYEQALADGDTERARELARELAALADRIDDVTADLDSLFAEIESILSEEFSETQETVLRVRNETVSEADAISEELFTETALAVEAVTEQASFLDPIVLDGQIQTVDGDPLANESVRITVGGTPVTVETDATGAFRTEYRPRELALARERLQVDYVPEPDSVYLGSTDNVTVSLSQVKPTLDVEPLTETVSYGDSVSITGTLAAQTVPVDGVSVRATLAGSELGSIPVGNGSFDSVVEIPARVPAGDGEFTIELPFEDQALAGVSKTVTVTVEETETTLSVAASQRNATTLRVSGRLATVDGDSVSNQSVALSLDGDRIGTVATSSDGRFVDTLAVSPRDEAEDVQLVAVFDGTGSNLGSSQARAVTTIEPPATEPAGSGESGNGALSSIDAVSEAPGTVVLLSLLVGGSVLLLAVGWWYRQPDVDETVTREGSTADTGSIGSDRATVLDSLFDHATSQLESGDADSAVQASYSAVRQQFETMIEGREALTHWEFYRVYADSAEAEEEDALRDLTEAYERAVYSPEGVQVDEAARTVERARQLCTRADGGSVTATHIAEENR
ncbi:hypothetical protein SAMN05216226_11917 [Halovenus aranensis]|uniref:DUF4129 domain-containing protein n=1 Tax=Halovenus aranensis TaxID=890420 RepID=A0A1G8Z8P8_9EURY|nr:hypothetical protein [Halovenus aranensis]SDK11428.1 hypothetical protein SAMN05216226_11917 [Halovenus aranensis]